jgi:hypothetical protein
MAKDATILQIVLIGMPRCLRPKHRPTVQVFIVAIQSTYVDFGRATSRVACSIIEDRFKTEVALIFCP